MEIYFDVPVRDNNDDKKHSNILMRIPWNKTDTDQYMLETEKQLLAYAEVIDKDTTPSKFKLKDLAR